MLAAWYESSGPGSAKSASQVAELFIRHSIDAPFRCEATKDGKPSSGTPRACAYALKKVNREWFMPPPGGGKPALQVDRDGHGSRPYVLRASGGTGRGRPDRASAYDPADDPDADDILAELASENSQRVVEGSGPFGRYEKIKRQFEEDF